MTKNIIKLLKLQNLENLQNKPKLIVQGIQIQKKKIESYRTKMKNSLDFGCVIPLKTLKTYSLIYFCVLEALSKTF